MRFGLPDQLIGNPRIGLRVDALNHQQQGAVVRTQFQHRWVD
ncbi:hypothetical protein AAHB37_17480 [Glutamicibacter halophytocola]